MLVLRNRLHACLVRWQHKLHLRWAEFFRMKRSPSGEVIIRFSIYSTSLLLHILVHIHFNTSNNNLSFG